MMLFFFFFLTIQEKLLGAELVRVFTRQKRYIEYSHQCYMCCEKRMEKGRDANEQASWRRQSPKRHDHDHPTRNEYDWCCCANAKSPFSTLFLFFVNTLGLAQINPSVSMQISMTWSHSQTIPHLSSVESFGWLLLNWLCQPHTSFQVQRSTSS